MGSNAVKYREIRIRFPNPAKAGGEGSYCVGGAVCKYFNGDVPFPGEGKLASVLRDIVGVPANRAKFLARHIIRNNDKGDFNKAWDYVAAALNV